MSKDSSRRQRTEEDVFAEVGEVGGIVGDQTDSHRGRGRHRGGIFLPRVPYRALHIPPYSCILQSVRRALPLALFPPSPPSRTRLLSETAKPVHVSYLIAVNPKNSTGLDRAGVASPFACRSFPRDSMGLVASDPVTTYLVLSKYARIPPCPP